MANHGPVLRARLDANLSAFRRREVSGRPLRRAAVAFAILPDDEGRACFVITRRAEDLRNHGGQWAIPGGSLDPGETPEQAALRELHEEVGLELDPAHLLGRLDDYATRSGFLITPVVVWCDAEAKLEPNPEEVAAAYRVPLSLLDHPDVPTVTSIPETDDPVLSIPIDMLGTSIHAPTAAMIYQLREVALHGRDTRVAHYVGPTFTWS